MQQGAGGAFKAAVAVTRKPSTDTGTRTGTHQAADEQGGANTGSVEDVWRVVDEQVGAPIHIATPCVLSECGCWSK